MDVDLGVMFSVLQKSPALVDDGKVSPCLLEYGDIVNFHGDIHSSGGRGEEKKGNLLQIEICTGLAEKDLKPFGVNY